MDTPQPLYSAESVRELDRQTIAALGIPSIQLMKRAARAAFAHLHRRWGDIGRIQVFCGGGNNGGDGYVIAALAAQKKIPVTVFACVDPVQLKGDAREAHAYACREGVQVLNSLTELDSADGDTLIVDALLGTGFSGELRPDVGHAIERIRKSPGPVFSVDIPSGLNADSGCAELAVQADMTVTFIGRKLGLYCGRGPALCGEVIFADLGAPVSAQQALQPLVQRYSATSIKRLSARPVDSFKNLFGHILVVGGDNGFGGAVLMAAQSSARCGAGLISLATRPEHLTAALTRCPEVMAHSVISGQELEPLLEGPDVIAVGPGLGRSPWSEQLLARAGRAQVPLVVDADALNILAGGRVLAGVKRDDWVLTPHVGEAARLLGCDTKEVLADPRAAAVAVQQKFSGVVILKGAGTLVAHDGGVDLINSGNPGMASGGMGDLLTGIVAALIGQHLPLVEAARLAVWLHGEAGDRAAEEGLRGLLATDLLPWIRRLVD
ncbi:NAD(P)H-hydrate dehydratase [Microbulbifer echini]|uniref:Bifunctional NAD(P)H-hydrate repair enzyme n=1 Tax=Microbulbifer echini TaxID=1529067 RepID=A0ABV4NK09_9GAMM